VHQVVCPSSFGSSSFINLLFHQFYRRKFALAGCHPVISHPAYVTKAGQLSLDNSLNDIDIYFRSFYYLVAIDFL